MSEYRPCDCNSEMYRGVHADECTRTRVSVVPMPGEREAAVSAGADPEPPLYCDHGNPIGPPCAQCQRAQGGPSVIDVERWEPAVHAEWALASSLADAGQDPEAAAAVLTYLETVRGVTIAVNAVERDYWLARLAEPSTRTRDAE